MSALPPAPPRLLSLDAFRGAVMLLMASAGLGLAEVARSSPDSAVWRVIGYHTDHVAWQGGGLWDFIQPAFMFMVGVALPFSMAARQARGGTFGRLARHALMRTAVLLLLAVVISSAGSRQTDWTFANVLAQIALGYPALFLLAFARTRTVWLAAGVLLLGYAAAFALYPLPAASLGPEHYLPPGSFSAHWEKHTNLAAAFDRWFLNLFPRPQPFIFNKGGYQTLNFLPSLATMLFGLLAGRLLRSEKPLRAQLARLAGAGAAGILLGLAGSPWCPIVKRIWTPTWALCSAGWVALALAGFVAIIEGARWRRWTYPLVVVGLNSIAMYTLFQLSSPFIRQLLRTHFGQDFFSALGPRWVPLCERGAVLVVLWLVVWWMHRRRVYLRI